MIYKKPLPDADKLRAALRYEPSTGKLFWKKRTPKDFESHAYGPEHGARQFNASFAGKEALISSDKWGYRSGRVCGEIYKAHRVIWKMVYGEDPVEIDHINGICSDNRLVNLRSCTRVGNLKNKKRYRNNSGGVGGVTRRTSGGWRVRLHREGKLVIDRTFQIREDAVKLRDEIAATTGFTARHGA